MIRKSGVARRIAPRTFVIGVASSDLPRLLASLGLVRLSPIETSSYLT
jgi:hypothetical protein